MTAPDAIDRWTAGAKSLRAFMDKIRSALPEGRALPRDIWQRRHNGILILLWAHVIGIPLFGISVGAGIGHSLVEGLPVAATTLLAGVGRIDIRVRSAIASLGLVTASAILVHLAGGVIELHFHFFVMLGIIILYQDWLPFLVALLYVVLHHGLVGQLLPTAVYNHPAALRHPWRWAAVHGAFVLAASVAHIVSWGVNEAQRKQSEAIQRAREVAERANAAKSEFLSRMSHELRTPLNAILGFGQLLEMDSLNSDQRESVDLILRAGRHLLGLVDRVLQITSIERGGLTLSPEAVPLAEAVQESFVLVQPLAAQRHIQLRSDVSSQDEIFVGRQQFRQVLVNLLSNAIKYNVDGGWVAVSCPPAHSGRVRVNVTDSGPGISPEKLDRLFTPFERFDAEQKGIEGTGLGLALTKWLVEAMGGTIGVARDTGRGATFFVEFPVADGIEARRRG